MKTLQWTWLWLVAPMVALAALTSLPTMGATLDPETALRVASGTGRDLTIIAPALAGLSTAFAANIGSNRFRDVLLASGIPVRAYCGAASVVVAVSWLVMVSGLVFLLYRPGMGHFTAGLVMASWASVLLAAALGFAFGVWAGSALPAAAATLALWAILVFVPPQAGLSVFPYAGRWADPAVTAHWAPLAAGIVAAGVVVTVAALRLPRDDRRVLEMAR